MKRLGMFLVLLSVSMFALGCAKPKETPPATPPTVTEGETPATGETPAPEAPPAGDTGEAEK